MSYDFYKILHVTGILIAFVALGALILAAIQKQGKQFVGKKFAGISHGIGLTFALVGGFGLAAKMHVPISTGWVSAKLIIWVILGGIIALIYRKQEWAKPISVFIIILGALAVYFARYKPF